MDKLDSLSGVGRAVYFVVAMIPQSKGRMAAEVLSEDR